jgi:hypothetical protein
MSKKKPTNAKNVKLTLTDLIKNADKIKARKKETKELYIKEMDATITIMKPDRETILDSYDMEEPDGNLYLVYECVVDPNLKDQELQNAYGVTGYDIVDEIFDPGVADAISKEIVKFAGYGDSVSIIEDIKN